MSGNSAAAGTTGTAGPFIEIPTFLYEGNAEQLQSHEATTKNIFWMRAIASGVSLICCFVMGSVKNIGYTSLQPDLVFKPDCPYHVTSGDFYYDSYKLCIAVSSLIFIHSTIFVGYYLLPTDLRGLKHIPGL